MLLLIQYIFPKFFHKNRETTIFLRFYVQDFLGFATWIQKS